MSFQIYLTSGVKFRNIVATNLIMRVNINPLSFAQSYFAEAQHMPRKRKNSPAVLIVFCVCNSLPSINLNADEHL